MMLRKETSDRLKQLVEACKSNGRSAQLELYSLYANDMYNSCLRIVKDSQLAEDIVQEAFIAAFKSIKNFRNDVPFSAWLRKIVVNMAISAIRANKITTVQLDEKHDILLMNSSDDTEELREIKENQMQQIKSAIMNLPDGYRVIFSLYYLEGYDHDEISGIMKITPSTSRSQLTRAKQKLIGIINLKEAKHGA